MKLKKSLGGRIAHLEAGQRKSNASKWFCRGSTVYDSVLFVPPTPKYAFAKSSREHELLNNQGRTSSIKIVERVGTSIRNIPAPAPIDPWIILVVQQIWNAPK